MSSLPSGADSPLGWLRRRLAPLIKTAPTQQGLILSGGGSCISFHIGALRYLYDVQGINPQVITGTSAGSIVGSVLAQYGEAGDQAAAVRTLEGLIRAMETSEDMFEPHQWFKRVRQHAPTWARAMELRRQASARPGLLQSVAQVFNRPAAKDDDDAAPSKSVGQPWSPTSAFEALGAYWEAGRTSGDLQLIVQGLTEDRSAFTPGKIVDQIADPVVFDPQRLKESPVELRIATVSLEAGEVRYVNGDGVLLDSQDQPLMDEGQVVHVDMIQAITASCSIPAVFPPVPLAGEHYVDGAVRENVPFAVAESIGVGESFTLVATPPSVVRRESFANADMLSIVSRSAAEIMSDEIQRDEVAYARRAGSVVIQPEIAVHDTVTVDPGLIGIAIDYGYLRAQDICRNHDEARQDITRNIVRTRLRIWDVENTLWQPSETEEAVSVEGEEAAPASPQERQTQLDQLAELKTQLRDLVASLPTEERPEGADGWWQTFEGHNFEITASPHWL